MKFYLDSQLIGLATGMQGAEQVGAKSVTMYVGDPFGPGITGLVDNFAFIKGALSAEQIADSDAVVRELMSPYAGKPDVVTATEATSVDPDQRPIPLRMARSKPKKLPHPMRSHRT